MSIIINITESNNKLDFTNTYCPIVCGNSNYVLKFNFSEIWQKCKHKVAFFVVDGNKVTVDFENDECPVPIMPNSSFAMVSLMSNDGETQLSTTTLKIRLEPTMAGGDLSEFDQQTNTLSNLLAAINKIENGELDVNSSRTAKNVSNTNFLINSDFKINQRGLTTYNSSELNNKKYTVDRWKFSSNGKVNVNENGILYTATSSWNGLGQVVESASKLSNKTVTFSMKYNANFGVWAMIRVNDVVVGNTVSSTESNIDNIISVTTTLPTLSDNDKLEVRFTLANIDDTIQLYWAKLEIGASSTFYSPKSYAEELAHCQRYYYKFNASQNYTNMGLCGTTWTATNFMASISLPQQLRGYPTVTMNGSFRIAHNNIIEDVISITRSSYDVQQIGLSYIVATGQSWSSGFLQSNNDKTAYIEFDSEIY